MSFLLVLAQAAPGGTLQQLFQSLLLPMIFVFGIFYLIVFRPQLKKQREHDALIAGLKKGDRVITSSGFYGEVAKVEGEIVVLKLNDSTPVRVSKRAIADFERSPGEAVEEKK